MPQFSASISIAVVCLLPSNLFAASTSPQPEEREAGEASGEGDSLASQTADPTARLLAFNLEYEFTDLHGDEASGLGDRHRVTFKPVLPFSAWGVENLLRVVIPYDIETPEGSDGLADLELYDLVVFEHGWGRWGLGPVVSFSPSPGPEDNTFQGGPAGGVVAQLGDFTFGVFSRSFFSADVGYSLLQPLFTYKVTEWLNVGLSDMDLELDWYATRWLAVPVGVELEVITALRDQPIKLALSSEYNLLSEQGMDAWTVTTTIALLVPGLRP